MRCVKCKAERELNLKLYVNLALGIQSRGHFFNPGIRDWRISDPGILDGQWNLPL